MSIKEWMTRVMEKLKVVPIYASGTKSVIPNAYTDFATITLPANGRYLVLASTVDGIAASITAGCFIRHDGTPSKQFGNGYSRITSTSGQGICAWKYFETGSTSVTVKVSSHGYYGTAHNVDGYIIAFPILGGGGRKSPVFKAFSRFKGVAV